MFHWQWFILFITIFFVVSNGGERIYKKRIKGRSIVEKVIKPPKKLSTDVKFPLWVRISGFDNIGAKTVYKNISDNLYEFTLPFIVEVKQSDVLVNRSAKQDENLAFPFLVRISQVGDGNNKTIYANETTPVSARLSFPFDLQVATLFGAFGGQELVIPSERMSGLEKAGWVTLGVSVLCPCITACLVCAILIVSCVRAAVVALNQIVMDILRPIDYKNMPPPRTSLGKLLGGIAGGIVGFIPILGPVLNAGIINFCQALGDGAIRFIEEIFRWGMIGTASNVIFNSIYYVFNGMPFKSREDKPQPGGFLPPPPPVYVPAPPLLPSPTDMPTVIRIYYGQPSIPGFPEYLIIWPGQQEPLPTNQIILRPIIPTLPMRPNIRLVWPIEANNPMRPNFILIQPGQVYIPGYVNVVIVWPGQPEVFDTNIITIHQNQDRIPNILGVVLLWPGLQITQPLVFYLQPGQRQHPQLPTVVFKYPEDPQPPIIPGITIVFPPNPQIPGYPGITIVWPGTPPPITNTPIVVLPDDYQVPGLPNVVIILPNQPMPPPQPGIIYIQRGQPNIPGYPQITLSWPPPPASPPPNTPFNIIYIPPGALGVPGFPDYLILRPGGQQSNSPKTVKVGDCTLPDNPNVQLMWLETPSDLVLKPVPDIYNVIIIRAKRSIGQFPTSMNAFADGLTLGTEDLCNQEAVNGTSDQLNRTFNAKELDKTLQHYGDVKLVHEKVHDENPWYNHLNHSELRQRFKKVFGLSFQS